MLPGLLFSGSTSEADAPLWKLGLGVGYSSCLTVEGTRKGLKHLGWDLHDDAKGVGEMTEHHGGNEQLLRMN